MRTYIKAYMSLNFGQIPPLTTELAALERLKIRCHHVISVDIDPIFFKLADNKDMHNIINEFEFRPDRTTDYGVSCPWASKKYPYRPYNGENGVSTFSLLFLIGSFWYFHVTRTSIKAWMSLNFLKWDLTLAHWTQVSDRCPLGYLLVNECCGTLGTTVNEAYFASFSMEAHVTGITPGCEDTDFYISTDTAFWVYLFYILSIVSQCMHFPVHKMHIR